MSIGLRLDLRQTQQLVMTPQLQQAIKLLQMNNVELSDFVDSEIEKNPLLRVESQDAGAADPEEAPASKSDDAPASAEADSRVEDHTLTGEVFDTGTENLYDDAPGEPRTSHHPGSSSSIGSAPAGDGPFLELEDRLAEKPGLRDHLRGQLGQARADAVTVALARFLVEELDEHGYMRTDLAEMAGRLSVPLARCEAALALLQDCEPTGVGARDVGECLALQLKDRDALTPEMETLLANLDLLAKGDFKRLRALCRVDEQELSCLVHELRRLDPRPCAAFDSVEPETLVPDVLLSTAEWGGFRVELNPDTLPRVLIDRTYIAEIGTDGSDETRRFIQDCQANASWLIKSLDQRARTIVKIASEIVLKQERFFREGVSGLRPLTLRDVADAVGMHESTASRVTANKYIATDRGIFELKFFFTNAVGGEGDFAAEAVRHRIKALVESEAPDAILSDDTIVEMLETEGIEIARRTVAKYRKSLDIPSSVARRRQKSVGAARA